MSDKNQRKIYNFKAIRDGVLISRYLRDRGYEIRGGKRFNALWRGGDSFSCCFDDQNGVWFDHKEGNDDLSNHHSVIDLCMHVENITTPLAAASVLGERYGINVFTVIKEEKKLTRGEILVKQGYALIATYAYENEEGVAQYFVDRYQRTNTDGTKEKEFVQRSTTQENLNGVKRLLYNLPAVIKSSLVYIVEGEKDVETMRRLGLIATTNSGGAKYWNSDFNHYFAQKDVVILPDNDDTGKEHGRMLYAMLSPLTKSCKMAVVSKLPKGDVTDFMEKEGGNLNLLNDIIKESKVEESELTPDVAAAKAANVEPLRNYCEVKDGKKIVRLPRTINDIVNDTRVRFLGFPRVIGSTMFDWCKDKNEIVYIYDKDDLFAWMQGCSNNIIEWCTGSGYVAKAELYSRIKQTSTHYNSASKAPFFPNRDDVFPMYQKLPKADPTHYYFWELINLFSPASEAHRTLLAAFMCAPMFYDGKNPRPAWLIDTEDGQGSGKTTVVELCALLYGEVPIGVDLVAIEHNFDQLKKRLISYEGRQKRIVLFDNITKTFKSSNLANIITASSISERAAYGRGEESRPNDITFCATMNGATLDTDMATRCYTIRVKKVVKEDPFWLNGAKDFINQHRKQIHADILDMLAHAKVRTRKGSRFGVFDSVVLSAVCATDDEFEAANKAIHNEANAANEDAELAEQFEEAVNNALVKYAKDDTGFDETLPCYLRYCDLENVLAHTDGQLKHFKKHQIRLLAKGGRLENWSVNPERLPAGFEGVPRSRGIFYGKNKMDMMDVDGKTRVQVVQFNDLRVPRVVSTIRLSRDLIV